MIGQNKGANLRVTPSYRYDFLSHNQRQVDLSSQDVNPEAAVEHPSINERYLNVSGKNSLLSVQIEQSNTLAMLPALRPTTRRR